MNKDRAIIVQVAAKIASELTNKNQSSDAVLSEYAYLFGSIKDIILDECMVDASTVIREVFPGAKEVNDNNQSFQPATDGDVTVVGQQHGELPQWLISACRKDGITRIYDNRDGLAHNPKRPWFKAVDDKEKAYWPPRSR
jgi:hypothetical protein